MSAPGVAEHVLSDLPSLAHLAPPVVGPADPIDTIVAALSRDPGATMAFVTDQQDRLLGVVPEHALDADLITLVLPPAALPALVPIGGRDALRAARGRGLTAGELMTSVGAVTPSTTVSDAIALMWRAGQRAMPLVDGSGALLGYVTLFELLAVLLPPQPPRSAPERPLERG